MEGNHPRACAGGGAAWGRLSAAEWRQSNASHHSQHELSKRTQQGCAVNSPRMPGAPGLSYVFSSRAESGEAPGNFGPVDSGGPGTLRPPLPFASPNSLFGSAAAPR